MTTAETRNAIETIEVPLSAYPGIPQFALDHVSRSGGAGRFLPVPDVDAASPRPRPRATNELVEALKRTNRAWDNDVDAELDAWATGQSVAIVAGQQVGFGGGPLYTWSKIASMLALRDRLAASGKQSTLFFWMATEDHDFDEVAALAIQRGGDVVELHATELPRVRSVVGRQPLPPSLVEQFGAIYPGVSAPWLDAMTFGESFALLLAGWLRGKGVVLVDSLLPELRRAGAPLFREILEHAAAIEESVQQRSRELDEAGYPPQVVASADQHYSLLYRIDASGERVPIRSSSDGFAIGRNRFGRADLAHLVELEADAISTGVVARPILQDYVLQPEIFVGGPAEVSYYAQIAGAHAILGVELPQVVLRGHALVAVPSVRRIIDRYAIRGEELFLLPVEIAARREAAGVAEMERSVDDARRRIEAELDAIGQRIAREDPTMRRPVERATRSVRYHFGKLATRGRAVVARRERERFAALEKLHRALMPGGLVQERKIGWVGFAIDCGGELLEKIARDVKPDSEKVVIVSP